MRRKEEIAKKKGGTRKKNKAAKITRVEFLDKNENPKNVFKTGEDISVRIYFEKNKDVPEINFGVALFNQENNYIFGVNTTIDKIDTKKYIESNFFQVDYANIPLKTNGYFVKAGIFGKNDAIVIDFLDKSKIFRVVSQSENQGIVELNYKWS
jgi:hypothetical protein